LNHVVNDLRRLFAELQVVCRNPRLLTEIHNALVDVLAATGGTDDRQRETLRKYGDAVRKFRRCAKESCTNDNCAVP